jgi:hypothetical protein
MCVDLIFNNNLITRRERTLYACYTSVIRKSLLVFSFGDLDFALPEFFNCFFVDGEGTVLNLVHVLAVGNFFI